MQKYWVNSVKYNLHLLLIMLYFVCKNICLYDMIGGDDWVMEITKKTIIDNIEDRSGNNLSVTAFESLGGSSIDYKTFFEMIDVYARGFKEIGVKNGDMVSLCSAGTLDTMLNFAALNRLGAIVLFVNPNYLRVNGKKYIDETHKKLMLKKGGNTHEWKQN